MTNENRLLLTAAVVVFISSAVTSCYLHAAELDPDGVYCSKDAKIWIGNGKVAGPGWSCKLGNYQEGAKHSQFVYKATCKGRESGLVMEDASFTDHEELHLPGTNNVIKLYNCPLKCCKGLSDP